MVVQTVWYICIFRTQINTFQTETDMFYRQNSMCFSINISIVALQDCGRPGTVTYSNLERMQEVNEADSRLRSDQQQCWQTVNCYDEHSAGQA